MNLAEICIKRPVFTIMLNLALVVLGIFSYRELGLDLFPKTDNPVVRISATLPGASPEEMELEVARVLEEAANTVGGIELINSSCSFGNARVIVRFDLEKDPDVAAQEIRDKIARVIKELPEGTDPPTVQKIDPDASPVLTILISSPMKMRELSFFTQKHILEPLQAVNGVGDIQMVGEKKREIQVILDAQRLGAVNVAASQLKDALKSQNLEVPGGNITKGDREYVLRNLGRVLDPKDFGNIIVSDRSGPTVRVSDVGTVIDGEEELRSLARLDGKPCLALTVQKQTGVNTLDLIRNVKQKLSELKNGFPKDLNFIYIRDQSIFIEASIHELNGHLILGSVLASLVVLLFMGNLVSTLITALAIPVSIVSTFLFMKIMGFTLNNMTMLGLTLAIGIVIDDAIVVLENIFRHMEELGSDAEKAAKEATAEIYMAVLATSLSLAVIFVPVAFMYGIIGNLLNNYGLTIAFSILVSIFVSFTLTPMLCSVLFKFKFARGGGHSKDSWFYSIINRIYGSLLRFALRQRWLIILISFLCLATLFPMSKMVKMDFLPPDDTSEFSVNFRTDEGCSLEGTDKILKEVEGKLGKLPGIVHMYSTIGEGGEGGVNRGSVFIQLVDLSKRKFSQFESMAEARKIMKDYPDFRPSVQPEGPQIMGGGRADIMLFMKGPDLYQINVYTNDLVGKLRKNPIFGNVNSSFIERKPEIQVKIDRDRIFKANVRMDTVFNGLRTLIGGQDKISRFQEKDELYEVRTRLKADNRDDVQTISSLLFSNSSGGLVRLDSIASITYGFGPAQINRTDRQRSITVSATLAKDKGLGEGNDAVIKTIKAINLPPEYSFGFGGKAKEMARTTQGFVTAFFISAIFMYMILASQFESFLHPLTIMLSLPLSLPFALLSLLLAQSSLNVYSALGVFMLFGIVKKNAILQIDYTNTLREGGMERDKAVLEANHARFRPILMTTLTLVAGMLPMALGTGPGSATRSSMAIVIIGGQSLCLLITLLLTPVAYTLFDDLVNWVKARLPKLQ